MSRCRMFVVAITVVAVLVGGCGGSTEVPVAELEAPSGLVTRRQGEPRLVVVAPQSGEVVRSPVRIDVELENYQLAAKGVSREGEGHLHVIADSCVEPGQVIGDEYVHVGSGGASAEIELEPGQHRLCIQLGDGFHTAVAVTTLLDVVVAE